MKKQKINKTLSFKKEIIMDLQSIKGGNAPQTQPVNTYRCGPTYGGPCGPDPYPNPQTCSCEVPTVRDSVSGCHTLAGYGCVLDTINGNCTIP